MASITKRISARTVSRRSKQLHGTGTVSGLELGVRQSGMPLVLPRPDGDPQHVLLAGTTGSGKSAMQRAWWGAAAGLEDVAMIGLDPKRTALGMAAPRFTLVAKSIRECTDAFVLLWNETERRLEIMEDLGVDEWQVDYGGPFILAFIDELVQVSSIDGSALAGHMTEPQPASFGVTPGMVTAGNKGRSRSQALKNAMADARTDQRAQGVFLSALARLCRSAGIQIVAATQYPMSEVVDPQVRANLDLRIMLRVPSNEMVKVCLGDGNYDDITADSISRDERGGCWISGIGTRPVRARGFWVTTGEGRARAVETAHLRWAPEDVFVGQNLAHLGAQPTTLDTSAVAGPNPVTGDRVPDPMALLNSGPIEGPTS